MKKINKVLLLLLAILAIACNSEPTLQKYYVDHQNDDNFVLIDVPSSLFIGDNSAVSEEDKKVIASIKKANVLALPINESNQELFTQEKAVMETILKDEKYKVLMKFGSSNRSVKVMYLGEEQAIDEVIVYASDNTKGFAVARLLGDNMNFSAIMKLMKSATNGDLDLNLGAFQNFGSEIEKKSGNKRKNDTISIKLNDTL